jgi:hypothetical protein
VLVACSIVAVRGSALIRAPAHSSVPVVKVVDVVLDNRFPKRVRRLRYCPTAPRRGRSARIAARSALLGAIGARDQHRRSNPNRARATRRRAEIRPPSRGTYNDASGRSAPSRSGAWGTVHNRLTRPRVRRGRRAPRQSDRGRDVQT